MVLRLLPRNVAHLYGGTYLPPAERDAQEEKARTSHSAKCQWTSIN